MFTTVSYSGHIWHKLANETILLPPRVSLSTLKLKRDYLNSKITLCHV